MRVDRSLGPLYDLGRRHGHTVASPGAVTSTPVMHRHAGIRRAASGERLARGYDEIHQQVGIAVDAAQARNLEFPRGCIDKVGAH